MEVGTDTEAGSSISILRFAEEASPSEQEGLARSILKRVAWCEAEAARRERLRHRSTFWEGGTKDLKLWPIYEGRVGRDDLVFTSHTRPFLGHVDVTLIPMRETVAHRLMRTRNLRRSSSKVAAIQEDEHELVPAIAHVARPPTLLRCQACPAPAFLARDLCPRVCAGARREYASDRAHAHSTALAWQTGGEVASWGARGQVDGGFREPREEGGVYGCRPQHGFSNIVIPGA